MPMLFHPAKKLSEQIGNQHGQRALGYRLPVRSKVALALLTNNRILIVRETRAHRTISTMRRQIIRYEPWEVFLDLFSRRRESLALPHRSASHNRCSRPAISKHAKRSPHLLEIRQQTRPSPPRITQPLPSIIISRRASIEKHAVDDSPAADYSASVKHAGTIVQSRLRNAGGSLHVFVRDRKAWHHGAVFLAIAAMIDC
jgi:hypothetical protein